MANATNNDDSRSDHRNDRRDDAPDGSGEHLTTADCPPGSRSVNSHPELANGPTWHCPVCNAEVPHPHRPGRARVYCANSCKQRAYRWRCRDRRGYGRGIGSATGVANAAPTDGGACAGTPGPAASSTGWWPERAHTRERTHALRPQPDFTASLRHHSRTGRPLQLTACGAFAWPASDAPRRFAHTKFYAPASWSDPNTVADGSCATCTALMGVPIEPAGDIVTRIVESRRQR